MSEWAPSGGRCSWQCGALRVLTAIRRVAHVDGRAAVVATARRRRRRRRFAHAHQRGGRVDTFFEVGGGWVAFVWVSVCRKGFEFEHTSWSFLCISFYVRFEMDSWRLFDTFYHQHPNVSEIGCWHERPCQMYRVRPNILPCFLHAIEQSDCARQWRSQMEKPQTWRPSHGQTPRIDVGVLQV